MQIIPHGLFSNQSSNVHLVVIIESLVARLFINVFYNQCSGCSNVAGMKRDEVEWKTSAERGKWLSWTGSVTRGCTWSKHVRVNDEDSWVRCKGCKARGKTVNRMEKYWEERVMWSRDICGLKSGCTWLESMQGSPFICLYCSFPRTSPGELLWYIPLCSHYRDFPASGLISW